MQRPAVEQRIAGFEEPRPNITIEPQVVPSDDYWTKLQTGVAGGSTYDVFWMNADGLPVYASQGALVSIQEIVDDGSINVDAYPDRYAASTPSRTRSTASRAISTPSRSSITRTSSTRPV